ncbi:hypothetical protein JRO89_XS10G0143900 [Xanthoceras sorbifolium]|uniref:laccase n=1 Tax=Xanthoceras sorbifolium TaxID=99658 RepID=A0ABQ8HIP9_9ROSI|nr:hypothetical protein JRO89_XS10G0143900 [Xanthoceras sorbifolium]
MSRIISPFIGMAFDRFEMDEQMDQHIPIIILPKHGTPYPFAKPYKEVPIIFGEWFNTDPEAVIRQALQTGGGPIVSDAYIINGLPGPFYKCSAKVTIDTFNLKVKPGKSYLLLLINAALNEQLFFSIANHTLTIVEANAVYVKPFETETLLIASGQTTNVLLQTKPYSPNAKFYMTARPYQTGLGTFDNSTVAGILEYEKLPRCLRLSPCQSNKTCLGAFGDKFVGSVNNVSFTMPKTALLQAHYFGHSKGVYATNFPTHPKFPFNYTGTPPENMNIMVSHGTKLVVVPFNTSVELIMQDTSILGVEDHPLHLHGYNFFVVGRGFGKFDPEKDPAKFNLIDPVERNTVGLLSRGWVAIRFLADNPGVWFMHCHVETHMSWGLMMVWIVLDGEHPHQKLLPPPSNLPKC